MSESMSKRIEKPPPNVGGTGVEIWSKDSYE